MIGFTAPLALLVLVPLVYLWWRLGRGPRTTWALRVAILALCALMVAGPVLRRGGDGRRIVFLVDRSLSAGKEALESAAEMLGLARREMGPQDEVRAVTFGDGASALVGSAVGLSELGASNLDDASDLRAGLRLAGSLCGGAGGRVFVVSDGLYTGPDPREHLPELRRRGVTVDYWPIRRERGADAAITRIETPERVPAGQPFEMLVEAHSPGEQEATLRVDRAGRTTSQQVSLQPGPNRFIVRDIARRPGLALRTVSVTVPGDAVPENNRARAATQVVGPAELLLVNSTGAPDNLSRALAASDMKVRVSGPELPVSSALLKHFRAVILENVALSALSDRADAALRNYVTELGGGLLVTGGRSSFAAGGYYQSRVEDILPVSMERKEEYRRPPLAMGIVLDRSGSMAASVGGGQSKIDLANRAAAEAIALLYDQDQVAVFAVDSAAHREVGLTPIKGNMENIRRRILSIESRGGGIFVYNGLRAAVGELAESDAPNRHIVLFADAADSEQPDEYKKLIETWTRAGGTISVIGLGTDTDTDAEFLKDIARRGGGEVFFTTDPAALPRVFCQDAMRVARKTFLEQETGARITPLIVRLGELGLSEFPSFLGYNLCYTREDAAPIVKTTDDHGAPVVAVWQRGLGRVGAVTCEVDGPYTGALREWDGYKPFFSTLTRWLRRDRDDPALFGSIVREGRRARVILELDEDAAQNCTGASAYIIPPDESDPEKLALQWTSPRTLEAGFRLERGGIYHGVIRTREGKRAGLPAVVLPYSPEFEPKPADAGVELLKSLADATGGRRVMHVADLFRSTPAVAGGGGAVNLAPFLAPLVLLLILADIATRKALWPHLVPDFLSKGARATARASATAARSVIQRAASFLPTRRKKPPTYPTEPTTETEEEPIKEKEDEEKGSVFDRAKRRARH